MHWSILSCVYLYLSYRDQTLQKYLVDRNLPSSLGVLILTRVFQLVYELLRACHIRYYFSLSLALVHVLY